MGALFCCSVLSQGALISAAQADTTLSEGQGYLGATIQSYDYSDALVSEASPSALRLQAGAKLSDQLAVEAHYGVGLSDESVQVFGVNQTLEISHFRAAYLKPLLPVNPQLTAYGLIGYAEAEMLTQTLGGIAESSFREYGASYGFGAQFHLNPYTDLSIEYMRLLDEVDLDASSLGLGVTVAF
jgi:hypothetical protein